MRCGRPACGTLTAGGPAASGIPTAYWGPIVMDGNIIDKSDGNIIPQLEAKGTEYPKGTRAEYERDEKKEAGSGKIWGKTVVQWDALGFICKIPLKSNNNCNVRPPASTPRPAATAPTPSPAAPCPHAPHRPTTRPPPAAGPG